VADGVRVETDGLHKFSNQVPSDTSTTLASGYSRASVDLSTGVAFGANNASGGVAAAKERYQQSLKSTTQNIEAYLEAAEILAAAAGKVADAFEKSDGRSARSASQVQALMEQAVAEAQARRVKADGHPSTRGGAQAI
jgi:hypothetical protein